LYWKIRRMSRFSNVRLTRKPASGRYWGVALLAVSVVVAVGCDFHSLLVKSPDKLLLRSYTERRPLELRISGAEHAAFLQDGKRRNSAFDEPQALLEAEAQIGHLSGQGPITPLLLSSIGRASLLRWSYENAITAFEQALELNPASPDALNDLASAYFERAESEKIVSDYGTAFELQSRALRAQPDNVIVLFNRAITAERLFLFEQCFRDWAQYLRLDSSGPWADEARDRLRRVRSEFEAHEHGIREPLLSPAEFIRRVIPSNPQTWEQVDPRIEEYLAAAITDWLPAAFPVDARGSASESGGKALAVLALILRERHGDTWLTDLLPSRPSVGFAKAVIALSQAVTEDNATENFTLGRQASVQATRLFESAGNQPGAMRSQLEGIYALRFSDSMPECLREVAGLSPRVLSHSYRWLRIQLNLEAYNCRSGAGQLGQTRKHVLAAEDEAAAAHYPSIMLRALGFLAVDESDKGRSLHSWNICREGLDHYWSSLIRPTPGYNVYVHASELAEQEQRWHLGLAFEEQAASLLDRTENPIVQAVEYMHLAQAAVMAGAPDEAENGLAAARQLLASAPRTEVTENYDLKIEIQRARIDGQRGRTDSAVDRLLTLQPQLAMTTNWYTAVDYYDALGDLQKVRRQTAESVAAYETAVSLLERQRSSIQSEADRARWARQSVDSYRKLTQVLLDTNDPVRALSVWELYQSAALRPHHVNLPASIYAGKPSLVPLQKSLSNERAVINQTLSSLSNKTFLAYVVLDDGVAIWTNDGRGLISLRIDKNAADVRMLAGRIEGLCAEPSSSLPSIKATARQLYQILISPIASQLQDHHTLVVETDEILAGVPFQVLMDATGRYLVDSNSIVYLPGLHYVVRNSYGSQAVTPRSRAVVVESEVEGSHPALDDAAIEAHAVAAHFRGAHVLKGARLSLTQMRKELHQADVFHFAGHTLSTPEGIGLLISSNQKRETSAFFDSSMLDGASLPGLQVAVLSACSTEIGDERGTLDPEGLALAFLRAGAVHVVATRWNVDSAASSALMQAFYDALLAGQKVPDALETAELGVRQAEPHPYYWAGFDAVGP
jgi:CHAT domain-containing protein